MHAWPKVAYVTGTLCDYGHARGYHVEMEGFNQTDRPL